MEADRSQDLQGGMVRGRSGRADGVFPVWKTNRLKTQEELMFQFESEGRKKPTSPPQGSQAGEIASLFWGGSALLFYSGLQWIRWGVPTLGRAICITQSTDLNVKLIPQHSHTDTPKIVFDQICGHSQVDTWNFIHVSWHMKLTIIVALQLWSACLVLLLLFKLLNINSFSSSPSFSLPPFLFLVI